MKKNIERGENGAGDVTKRNRVGEAGSVGVEDKSVPRNET